MKKKSHKHHVTVSELERLIDSVPTKIDWYTNGPEKLKHEEPYFQEFYRLLQETFGKSSVAYKGDKTEKAWRSFDDFLSEINSVFSYFRNYGENLLSVEVKEWKEKVREMMEKEKEKG